MEHAGHALLELPAAVVLIAGGIVALGLAWRRAYRRRSSGVLIEAKSPGQLARSIALVPLLGLGISAIVVLGAALANGRLHV